MLFLSPLLQSFQEGMDAIMIAEVLLVETEFHEEGNGVFAVEGIAEDVNCLLELGRSDVGSQLASVSLLFG